MDDEELLLLLLIAVVIVAAISIPRIREATRQRKIEKERFLAETLIQSDQLKKRLDQPVPGYIKDAIREFMEEHGDDVRTGRFDENAISPLTYYGYRVGKARGRPDAERKKILEFVLFKPLPEIFPPVYREKWGGPGSPERLQRICNHITMTADRRASRPNYEVAVAEWRSDASWCRSALSDEVRTYRRYSVA